MIATPDALLEVQRHALVREMIELEPQALLILKTASLFTDATNRWQMYEECKRRARFLVGFQAARPELRTNGHYEAMIWAIDFLLPDTAEEDESEEEVA